MYLIDISTVTQIVDALLVGNAHGQCLQLTGDDDIQTHDFHKHLLYQVFTSFFSDACLAEDGVDVLPGLAVGLTDNLAVGGVDSFHTLWFLVIVCSAKLRQKSTATKFFVLDCRQLVLRLLQTV